MRGPHWHNGIGVTGEKDDLVVPGFVTNTPTFETYVDRDGKTRTRLYKKPIADQTPEYADHN